MEHKLVHFSADKTISSILKYIDKEPQKNLLKILGIVEKTFKMYPKENYAKMRNAVLDDSNSFVLNDNGDFISRTEKGLDVYVFMYRKDLGLCLQDYYTLTGYPVMLPRYTFGTWWYKNRKYTIESFLK